MAVATDAQIGLAYQKWGEIQAQQPEWIDGYIKLHGNPFVPAPPDDEAIKQFIGLASSVSLNVKDTIDPKLREQFVSEYLAATKKARERAATTQTIRERAREERINEVFKLALESREVAPEQRGLFAKILLAKSEAQTEKKVEELVPETIRAGEVAQVFEHPEAGEVAFQGGPVRQRFQNIKNLSNVQKYVAAPLLDAATDVLTAVIPDLKQGRMNKLAAYTLQDLINSTDKITTLFGTNVVNQSWYQSMIRDAGRLVQQGSQAGGAKTIIDDIAMSLFHGPMSETMIGYMELYHANYMQGKPPPSLAQLQMASMGIGAPYFRAGASIFINKAKAGFFKKLATSIGLKALIPEGWVAGLFNWGAGLLGGFIGWLTAGTFRMGKVPTDKYVIPVGCAVLALAPLLFIISQMMIVNTSLATRLMEAGGGQGQGQQLMDVTITATPQSQTGNVVTAMRYTITIHPKGSPSSFKINSLNVQFSIFGGSGSPVINAPTITPGMLADGSFSFVVPFGQDLNNSVVTATVNANADVGSQPNVNGSASVSTVIGNPPTGCFVFGGAGVQDGYGHTSGNWDSTAAVTSAISILQRAPQYIAKICSGGQPITIYRVYADFGGGSTSPPNSIFMYNACATTACATYTLAHETGHILDARTDLFSQYNNYALYAREGPLWTYPNAFSEHEDFAETMGTYVVWGNYTWGARHGHAGGNLNYPGTYPLHYEFAKGVFGCVEFNGTTSLPCGIGGSTQSSPSP